MAVAKDIDFTYSLTDRVIRLSLGELPDFSGAKFDGDFSLSLEEAQRRKHEYVAEQIGIGPGRRLLDLGCGWGPLLAYARDRGAHGVGVTLSSAQLDACRDHGLDVHLEDAREVDVERFGRFDAVASLGAFEHFCSPEEYEAGLQEDIYRDLFTRVSSLLPPGGRLYLQTMVWGRNMIPAAEIDMEALRRVPLSLQHEWPTRLHRDDQPLERAHRAAKRQKDSAQARAAAALGYQRRLPPGVHVGRQREPGLL